MKSRNFSKKKKVLITLFILTIITTFTICSYISLRLLIKDLSYDWHTETTPLAEETKQEVCKALGISEENSLCGRDYIIYGPDFYPTIIKIIHPMNGKNLDYAEIEKLIGNYKYYQTTIVPVDSGAYLNCYYDFNGDHKFPLLIMFNEDGSIREDGIRFSLGD